MQDFKLCRISRHVQEIHRISPTGLGLILDALIFFFFAPMWVTSIVRPLSAFITCANIELLKLAFSTLNPEIWTAEKVQKRFLFVSGG